MGPDGIFDVTAKVTFTTTMQLYNQVQYFFALEAFLGAEAGLHDGRYIYRFILSNVVVQHRRERVYTRWIDWQLRMVMARSCSRMYARSFCEATSWRHVKMNKCI